ncbi:hypothetical protein PR048_028401 [Dryococelus australis]|uniref:Uncharacterized protein n=1 Tax=Dryococelus australis TaxID=614101 RepID=A0ABQ9GD12_9NEOP|nr:hypothetical protein PR048_028401 [Dryococelus australis]
MSCLLSTAPVELTECNFLYITTPLVSPDELLSKVIKVLLYQLSIRDGVLWNGNRVVIPQSLQAKVLSILHLGHAGVVRTCMLARSYVW